ncbi:hypothetical protein [Fluviicoccus keumensis]|uniref:hypothetical protein n=1 Tax=Fluviicoccus keumensis TaxID=1435465 RepID=UPI00102CB7C1|nr:hypothetical protein [Fluviicoccus keumensis]
MSGSKERLRQLMAKAELDTMQVALLLEKRTMRKYSLRTVQAWVANEGRASSRECPAWVLENLEQIIQERQNSPN